MSPVREPGELLAHTPLIGHQLLRLRLPQLSQTVRPGSHLRIEGAVLPVSRARPQQQWLELLSPDPQPGWADGAGPVSAEQIDSPCLAPQTATPRALLLGEGMGMAPILFLAEQLKGSPQTRVLLTLLGFDDDLPFKAAPSQLITAGLPAGVIAGLPLLEEWHIPTRLATTDERPGCYEGKVTELAAYWLAHLQEETLRQLTLYGAATPTTLQEIEALARQYALPCQCVPVIRNA